MQNPYRINRKALQSRRARNKFLKILAFYNHIILCESSILGDSLSEYNDYNWIPDAELYIERKKEIFRKHLVSYLKYLKRIDSKPLLQ